MDTILCSRKEVKNLKCYNWDIKKVEKGTLVCDVNYEN